ncbi:MAG: flagellar basal body rod protein FlgC [Betaproteobacteria bacterium]
MSLFKIFEIASSGVTAQSQRLNATASNLANADSAAGPDGKAYQARQVVFQTVQLDRKDPRSQGVAVQGVIQDQSAPRRVHDPKNPMADDTGYVTLPNVNVAEEMVNMLSASRSYQTNLEVMNTAKSLMLKTLSLGS